jgi:hypothetical protein
VSRQHFKIGKGISITPVATRPSDPENGDVIYNSTNTQFEKYENGTWSAFASAGSNSTLSNLTSPTAINQDLIFNKSIALVKTGDKTGVASEALSVLTGSTTTTGSSGSLTLGSGSSASASGVVSLTSGATTLTGSTTGTVTIRSGNAGTGNTSSGAVTITTGTSTGTNVTGSLTLQTGSATGLAGSGNVTMNSGNVTTNTSGSSGVVSISSGTSVAGATGTTGIVSLSSGNHASASTSAGTVTVATGTQTGTAFSGTGGVTTITTGNITSATATGTTGGTNILTGNTAGSGGATGAVTVRSGNATSTGNSGAVILQTGSVTSGTRGTINMVDASLATATVGATWRLTNTTTGAGQWQPKVKAFVESTNNQSIANNTNTVIVYNSVISDTGSVYNAGNGRFTQPRAGHGRFLGVVSLSMTPSTTSTIYARVYKNGAEYTTFIATVPAVANTYSMPICVATEGVANDFWEIYVEQNAGDARVLTAGTTNRVCFEMD